jgi:hypothetical protein
MPYDSVGQAVKFKLDGKTHFILPKRHRWWVTWADILAGYRATGMWPDNKHPDEAWRKWVEYTRQAIRNNTLAEDQLKQLKDNKFPLAAPQKPTGAAATVVRNGGISISGMRKKIMDGIELAQEELNFLRGHDQRGTLGADSRDFFKRHGILS